MSPTERPASRAPAREARECSPVVHLLVTSMPPGLRRAEPKFPRPDSRCRRARPTRSAMSTIDDDIVSNTSANETFESVVARSRVAAIAAPWWRRHGRRGGRAVTAPTRSVRAVPVHADGRRPPRLRQGLRPPGRRAVARLQGHRVVERRRGRRAARLPRRRVDRLGRPGVGRPRVQARTPATPPTSRRSSGACTTTASCTSRSTVRRSTA